MEVKIFYLNLEIKSDDKILEQDTGASMEAAVPQRKDRRQQILNHFCTTQEKQQPPSGNKEGIAYPFLKIRPHQTLQRRQSPSRDASLAAASP